MIRSKKIKKISNFKKAKKNKLEHRCSYNITIEPPKFLNPYLLYRLSGDIILAEDGDLQVLEFSALNHFKLINGIEYNKKLELFSINMRDAPNALSCPWEYLVERLKSYNNKDSFEWAKAIESNQKNLGKILEETNKIEHNCLPSALEKAQLSKSERQEIIQNDIVSIQKYKLTENVCNMISVSLNEKAYNLMELSYPFLCNLVLKKGIPEIYPAFPSSMNHHFRKCIQKALIQDVSGEERPGAIIAKSGKIKPILWKLHTYYIFNPKKGIEFELIFSWKEDFSRPLTQIASPYSDLEKQFESETIHLKQKFNEYFERKIPPPEPPNIEKMCTYKELGHIQVENKHNA